MTHTRAWISKQELDAADGHADTSTMLVTVSSDCAMHSSLMHLLFLATELDPSINSTPSTAPTSIG